MIPNVGVNRGRHNRSILVRRFKLGGCLAVLGRVEAIPLAGATKKISVPKQTWIRICSFIQKTLMNFYCDRALF